MRQFLTRSLAAITLTFVAAAASPTFAGGQPSYGVVKYALDQQVSDARDALRLARNTLAQATRKVDSLMRQADRTTDLRKKLSLLREVEAILRTTVQLKRQIEDLEESLERLKVQREALLTRQREAEEQAALRIAQQAELALAALQTDIPPATEETVQRALSPALEKLFDDAAAQYQFPSDLRAIAAAADYAGLSNLAYHAPAYDAGFEMNGWKTVASRRAEDANNPAQVSAIASRSPDGSTIVIAYRGTVEGGVDWTVNFGLTGLIASQVSLADQRFVESLYFARSVKEANPGAEIIVTGHSLGGGIAQYVGALMAVEAVAFDPAPVARFFDSAKGAELLNAARISNFTNQVDPLYLLAEHRIVGPDPVVVHSTGNASSADIADWQVITAAKLDHSIETLWTSMAVIKAGCEAGKCELDGS